ncbi:aromatic ring-hydroxylating oxygenase subunit alpha [Mycolicibacterium sphagni]|uniref:aromatic ring-hydroxylating oxygenase subunit alpha n=1 Tax=Mycolicibacterium sphagni TaxID=1786 RepID=UPI001F3F7206|nr:SRPBCC family protein [Mycolicibacterium sphagni]
MTLSCYAPYALHVLPQRSRFMDTAVQPAAGVDRADLVRRLLGHLDAKSTRLADNVYFEPARGYIDPDQFAGEVDKLFRRSPLWVAWSAELPNAGDYKAIEIAQVPMIFLRGKDGSVRGFRNSCTHRGATLLPEGTGCIGRRIVCPYHAWSFDHDGKLTGIPHDQGFAPLDRSQRGLTAIPVQEKYGMIFACADPDGQFDLDDHLSGLGPELGAHGWANFTAGNTRTISCASNYKLAMDTYCEAYHFPYVHTNSLPTAIPNTMEVDNFGHHIRMTYPFGPIDELRGRPDGELAQAVLGQHMFIVYIIFPNVAVVTTDFGASAYQVLPGAVVGESTTTDHQIVTGAADDDLKSMIVAGLDYNFSLVDTEDYPLSERVFRSLRAGTPSALVFGRNEPALHLLHDSFNAATSAQ